MLIKCWYDVEILIITFVAFVKMYIDGGSLKTFKSFAWDTKLSQSDQKIKNLTPEN